MREVRQKQQKAGNATKACSFPLFLHFLIPFFTPCGGKCGGGITPSAAYPQIIFLLLIYDS